MALTPETLGLFVRWARLNPTIAPEDPIVTRVLLSYVALTEGDQRQVEEYRLRGTQIVTQAEGAAVATPTADQPEGQPTSPEHIDGRDDA